MMILDYLLIYIGLSIAIVFMFKHAWLYTNSTFGYILAYCVILFIVSVISIEILKVEYSLIWILRAPLISVIIYRGLLFCFIKLFKRVPENTFWSFERKPIQDVIFSGLFWLLGVAGPLFLLPSPKI